LPDSPVSMHAYYVSTENFNEQLREVVRHFGLDVEHYLFTRCLACNVQVQPIAKEDVRGKVPDKSFEGFDTFFQCPSCHTIYWGGIHLTNTKNKLKRIFTEPS
jgi:uncharacterized protein with PIN domain